MLQGGGLLDRRHSAKYAHLTRLCSELRSESSARRRGLSRTLILMNLPREVVPSPSCRSLDSEHGVDFLRNSARFRRLNAGGEKCASHRVTTSPEILGKSMLASFAPSHKRVTRIEAKVSSDFLTFGSQLFIDCSPASCRLSLRTELFRLLFQRGGSRSAREPTAREESFESAIGSELVPPGIDG